MKVAGTALVLIMGLSSAATAQSLPAAFQVSGIAAGDVLNIRAEPSATSPVVGTIGPYGLHVEVTRLSDDGRWGKVGLPEGNGWVAMRFLSPMAAEDPAAIPRPLTCFGTEPFWSASLLPRGEEFSSPDTGAVPLTLLEQAVSEEGFLFRLEEGPTLIRTVIVRRAMCNDGMSDREFGFSALMFTEAPDGNATVTGCCTLDHR